MDSSSYYYKRCRLCACENAFSINIFSEEGRLCDIISKIAKYLGVKVSENDQMPQLVCYQCLNEVQSFHNFRQKCEDAELILRNWNVLFEGKKPKETTLQSESLASEETLETSSDIQESSCNENRIQILPQIKQSSMGQIKGPSLKGTTTQTKKILSKHSSAVKNSHCISRIKSKNIYSATEKISNRIKNSQRNTLTCNKMKIQNRVHNEVEENENNRCTIISNTVKSTDKKAQSSDRVTIHCLKSSQTGHSESCDYSIRSWNKSHLSKTVDEKFILDETNTIGNNNSHNIYPEQTHGNMMNCEPLMNTIKSKHIPPSVIGQSDDLPDMLEIAETMTEGREDNLADSKSYRSLTRRGNRDNHSEQQMRRMPLFVGVKKKDAPLPPELLYMKTVTVSGRKRFTCYICQKDMASKNTIKEHMKIHTGERCFQCPVCSRTFRNKYMLSMHMYTHSDERAYKCDLCERTYKIRSHLYFHMRTHSDERPFECDICGAKFKLHQLLRQHIRKHTGEKPFKCKICGKSYTDSSTRSRHMRTHSNLRPYKCEICGMTFQQKLYLKNHISIHMDLRPFKCLLCSNTFRMKAHLKKHLTTIHKRK